MIIFNYDFRHVEPEHTISLLSLEREGAVFTWGLLKGGDEPDVKKYHYVRIPFKDDEIKEFVRASRAWAMFLECGMKYQSIRDIPGVPADIADRAEEHAECIIRSRRNAGGLSYSLAGFLGKELEDLLCFFPEDRIEILPVPPSTAQAIEPPGVVSIVT